VRPAHRALAAVATAVIVYNVAIAPDGETISEGVDELLTTHPVLTRAAVALLAMHVANLIAQQADPVHWAFAVARRRRVVVVVQPA
jgi:hypothetical protein